MTRDAAATSILEFLTFQNPILFERKPRTTTNSRNNRWFLPKEVRRWHEFDDLTILKTSFGGSLFREACQGNRILPHYPHIDQEIDSSHRVEDDTRDIIHKWSRTIVTAALKPISHEFHPAIWVKGDPPLEKQFYEPPPESKPERQQPRRESSRQLKRPIKQAYHRLKSDSSSVARGMPPSETGDSPPRHCKERFPKEYKPSSKWRSEWMIEQNLFDTSGEWERGKIKVDMAMPIRQAFTYCVQHMCRYGCILTGREAFIFRVRPRDEASKNQERDEQDPSALKKELMKNGLMEYVSIPWVNHQEGQGKCQTWTVNLALWFMHVLAGNHYEVAWRYDGLQDEKLVMLETGSDQSSPSTREKGNDGPSREINVEVEGDESSDSDDSDATVPFETSMSLKRQRSSDVEEEEYCLSFSKRQALEV